jgi:hypothetical protein
MPNDGSPETGYSYLPVAAGDTGNGQEITERAGCVSVATRVITHLQVDVDDCTKMTGVVVNESTQGRVHSCTLVPMSDWDEDVTCTAADWDSAELCSDDPQDNDDNVDRLDSDQNQVQTSKATFELVKIGELTDEVDCDDVKAALPAIDHSVPTITCNDNQ